MKWDHGVVRKKDARIVKGSPLARRILVKYTVPTPVRDELAAPQIMSAILPPTFVTLHSEGEVHVPLWHAYLSKKCEVIERARQSRKINIQRRLPMGPR